MKKIHFIIGIVVVTVIVLAMAVYVRSGSDPAGSSSKIKRPRVFYGVVIDQSGLPVRDAEIVIHQSKIVPNQFTPGGILPDRLPENRGSVYSGRTGTFLVMLPPECNYLEIRDIKKPGYKWVIDWAWQVDKIHGDTDSNQAFCLKGQHGVIPPLYEPDSNNPAIFPMHKVGDLSPATQPSRGGTDILRDNTRRINRPVELGIPSAGPASPTTPAEIEERIRRYTQEKHAAATSKPSE